MNRAQSSLVSRTEAFSLVEISIAIAVVAFAVVTLLGLLPGGLDQFGSALDRSVRTQIAQRLVTEVQQTDFDLLKAPQPLRYYDVEGTVSEKPQDSIYTALTEITPETKLPVGNPAARGSSNLITVRIRIAKDPGRVAEPFAPDSKLPISTHIAYVARNR